MRMLVCECQNAQEPLEQVEICGWIRTRRDSKGFSFIEVNDGSCLQGMQCIIDEGTCAAENLKNASRGAAVKIEGELVASPGKGQKWEIRARNLTLYGDADPETYPLQKKRHSDEFLRTIAHLRPRTNKYGALFRVRSELAYAIHEFFHREHFHYVHTPILTGSDCEGAGEMFRVTTLPQGERNAQNDFFSKECHLTVSGQLEAEAMAMALGRVYTFGPAFRAENSNTPRHAAEFWMIEPEMAFADLHDLMHLAERMLSELSTTLLERCHEDIALFDAYVSKGLLDRLEALSKEKTCAHISYREAISILQKSKRSFVFPAAFGVDLQTEHERYLAEEYCKGAVIIYDYPKSIKPFYMRDNDDGETVAAMDVLVPQIGEIIGGSQREERLSVLEEKIHALGQNTDSYWWYTDLRRFGSVPHSGFGLGFERLLMMLTGVSNIRDCIPFPRTPGSLDF